MDAADVPTFWAKWGQPVIDILTATPGVAAFLVGFIIGFLGTQWLKGPDVLPHDWPPEKRRAWVSRIAFAMYAIPCLLLWPIGWDWATLSYTERYLVVVLGLLASIALGFGSMWFYSVVMRELYARGWASEEKWSAEGRAKKRQKLVTGATGQPELVEDDGDTTGRTIAGATKLAQMKPKPPAGGSGEQPPEGGAGGDQQ